jgi:hypothetical protein
MAGSAAFVQSGMNRDGPNGNILVAHVAEPRFLLVEKLLVAGLMRGVAPGAALLQNRVAVPFPLGDAVVAAVTEIGSRFTQEECPLDPGMPLFLLFVTSLAVQISNRLMDEACLAQNGMAVGSHAAFQRQSRTSQEEIEQCCQQNRAQHLLDPSPQHQPEQRTAYIRPRLNTYHDTELKLKKPEKLERC